MATVGCVELGCGETTVAIYDRCGQNVLCELPHTASLEYDRRMDETSEAKITVNLPGSGGESQECCDCLGNVRSWLHTLVVFRDGDLVWGPGPVVKPVYKNDPVTIEARDVTAWLDVRVIREQLVFENVSAVEVARQLIVHALSPDDPCGLLRDLQIVEPDNPTLISKTYEPYTLYAGDALRELARTVIDFTVVGTSIIIGEPLEWGPVGTLTDDDFQTELEVEERGIEAATRWYVKGEGVVGIETSDEYLGYMGLIEQLAIEDNVTSQSLVDAGARNRLQASTPTPLYVNIPDGAKLAPSTPICFNQLVPGVLVNAELTSMCRNVTDTYHLTNVKVKILGTGDEQVGVTLAPTGTNFGQSGSVTGPEAS